MLDNGGPSLDNGGPVPDNGGPVLDNRGPVLDNGGPVLDHHVCATPTNTKTKDSVTFKQTKTVFSRPCVFGFDRYSGVGRE